VDAVGGDLQYKLPGDVLKPDGRLDDCRSIGCDPLEDRVQQVVLRANVLMHERVSDAGLLRDLPNGDRRRVLVCEELSRGVEDALRGLLPRSACCSRGACAAGLRLRVL